MRVPVTALYVLPLAVRVAGVFAAPDAPPQVVAVVVNGVDQGPGGLNATVQQATDAAAAPIVGVYGIRIDTTTLEPGDRVKVFSTATVLSQVQSAEISFSIGGDDPLDYVGHQVPDVLVDPLLALSDDFGDAAIDPSWVVEADGAAISEGADGMVFFPPNNSGTGAAWGGTDRGPIVYKLVTGDFRVTADVRAHNDAGDDLPPQQSVRFYMAGLIILDPRLDQVDAIDCGIGSWNNDLTFQTKNTIAGATTLYASSALSGAGTTGVDTPAYEIIPDPADTFIEARLRMCREGQIFNVHVSYDGGSSWAHSRTYDRTANPLAAELHVGLMTYSAFTNPANFQSQFRTGISFETIGPGFAPSCI